MAVKLSDDDVDVIVRLRGEGCSTQELAERFGVSPQHVRRVVRGAQRHRLGPLDAATASRSVSEAVRRFGSRVEVRGAGDEVRMDLAVLLAEQLDRVRASPTVSAAALAPKIARELLIVLRELEGTATELDFIDELRMRREARLLSIAAPVQPSA